MSGNAGSWLGSSKEDASTHNRFINDYPDSYSTSDKLVNISSFHDLRRKVNKSSLDPSGRLAALVDVFGRVMIVDMSDGSVVRMWKGYRNAQTAWMYAPERWDNQWKGAAPPTYPGDRTCKGTWGLYLVIYAGQRGVLEIWRMRYGPKTASISVGNNCKLLSVCKHVTNTQVYLLQRPSSTSTKVNLLKVQLPSSGRELTLKYYSQSINKKVSFAVFVSLVLAMLTSLHLKFIRITSFWIKSFLSLRGMNPLAMTVY
jgi:hypothetical protein